MNEEEINKFMLESDLTDFEDMEVLLLYVTQELIKNQSIPYLQEQMLPTSIFFSFCEGVLQDDNYLDEDKIFILRNAIKWVRDNEQVLKNYGERSFKNG